MIFTYWKHHSWSEVGFKTDLGILKIIGSALLLFVIIEPIFSFIIQPIINWIANESPDYSIFQSIAHDSSKYLKYLLFIWISAAIGEELLFRGFMFMQFKHILPEYKHKTVSMILISALLFSLPHAYQGLSGLLTTFVFGIIFGAVYVKYNYNLWITILIHGLIDSVFITLAFMDKLDYYNMVNF
ncbi:CPBP family intramembrane glutamic endopeptidase [Mariniflexile soesokkakense]|uniref:CPBP family intramembrane glutamic endopeptidase n=1 Tax=Mariniflexile soesokkakense TaxID=1343160 RepID=A0ABV0AF18_9FLAO